MTCQELANLPVGAIVRIELEDGIEQGEIIQAGQTVQIMWPDTGCTQIIDTNSIGWEKFTVWLEAK